MEVVTGGMLDGKEVVEARRGKKGHATPMRRQLRYWQPFNDW
jgi:hypothetical protein